MNKTMLLLAAGALCTGAHAADTATTVRPTDLKAKPFIDAATVTSLPEASKVEVVQRQASWMQVRASKKDSGWVKMLSLRFDQVGEKGTGFNDNLNVVFNIAKTGSGGSTATTGVKGISEEALKNPTPSPAQFAQLAEMGTTDKQMKEFLAAGKLSAKTMAYLPKPEAAKGEKK